MQFFAFYLEIFTLDRIFYTVTTVTNMRYGCHQLPKVAISCQKYIYWQKCSKCPKVARGPIDIL